MNNWNNNYNNFTHVVKEVINLHAPQKKGTYGETKHLL